MRHLQIVEAQLEGASNPLGMGGSEPAPFFMLLETHGSTEQHDVQKLDAFLEVCGGCEQKMGVNRRHGR